MKITNEEKQEKENKSIIKKVDDGFKYFNSGILEELTTEKKYYIKAFMQYIVELETQLNEGYFKY